MEKRVATLCLLLLAIVFLAACSTPLSTREKSTGIGLLGGAAAGGIIGSAVGHPGAGAAIGGALGAGAGALIGDQLQGREQAQQQQQTELERQQKEIEKNRALIEELKRSNLEASESDRGVTVNLPSVLFDFNSAALTPDGRQGAGDIARIVNRQARGRRIAVEGHASRERADQEAYNQELSDRRAQSVAEALEENGVSKDLVTAKGFGTHRPIASNDTEEGRRKNRRVEVIIEN